VENLGSDQAQRHFDPPEVFLRRRRHHADALFSVLSELPDLVLLTGMQGNIGDHLIWEGTVDLLTCGGLRWRELRVEEITASMPPGGTLVVPGSGAFHKFWHEWLPGALLEAARHFDRVVVLASSFDPQVKEVGELLSRSNVYAFARELRSYEAIKHFGRAMVSFDPALYFADFDDKALATMAEAPPSARVASSYRERAVPSFLRCDEGSVLGQNGLLPNPETNLDISLTSGDLTDFLNAIRGQDLVITDRLHVAVASIMLGKTVTYLDPYDAKISEYLAFVFGGSVAPHVSQCEIPWLLDRELVVAAAAS